MLKHLGVCRAAGGEQPPKSEGERERFAHARAGHLRLGAKKIFRADRCKVLQVSTLQRFLFLLTMW